MDCEQFKSEFQILHHFLPNHLRIDGYFGFKYVEHLLLSGKTLVLVNYEKRKANDDFVTGLVASQSNNAHTKGQGWVILVGDLTHLKKQNAWFLGRITFMRMENGKIEKSLLDEWKRLPLVLKNIEFPKEMDSIDSLNLGFKMYCHRHQAYNRPGG